MISQKTFYINDQIKSEKIFLVEEKSIVDLSYARHKAETSDLDLVQVSVRADNIPVCKIIDWGSFRYYSNKKDKKVRKLEQKKNEIKNVQISLAIGENDLERKLQKVIEWLEEHKTVNILILRRKRQKNISYEEMHSKIKTRLSCGKYRYKENSNLAHICVYN